MATTTDEPAEIFRFDVPLIRPFSTADRTTGSRTVVLVRVGDGPFGWGEAAPFPGQDEPVEDVLRASSDGGSTPTLSAALDEAAADLGARRSNVSLAHEIGSTNASVPISLAVGLDDPLFDVDRAVERGVSRFKLKIEPGRLDHVAEIRSRHPNVTIGLDANGSFGHGTTVDLDTLGDLDISYLEQPVADLRSTIAEDLRSRLDVAVFADESVRSVEDAEDLLVLDHVDGVVVKPGRLGWTGALAVRELANSSGKLWRASGLLETGVGRAYTDILAACPDAFVSDVAPAEWFLEADVTDSRYLNGGIIIPTAPGLGITVHDVSGWAG